MSALYAEGRIDKAFEAGKKAGEYAMQKNFDVHFRDAALKCALEANAVLSKHDDVDIKGMSFACPQDEEECAQLLLDKITECEATIPKTGEEDVKDFDPATLYLLFQIGQMAFSLLRKFF